jgi:hypothetical protein
LAVISKISLHWRKSDAKVRTITKEQDSKCHWADAPRSRGFARLAAILLAVGYWGHGARVATSRKRAAGSPLAKTEPLKATSEV